MNTNEFMKKLFKGADGLFVISTTKPFHINMDIDNKILADNINLLSKEMHMEVETEALTKKYKLKHERIYVEDISFLEEENGKHKKGNRKV